MHCAVLGRHGYPEADPGQLPLLRVRGCSVRNPARVPPLQVRAYAYPIHLFVNMRLAGTRACRLCRARSRPVLTSTFCTLLMRTSVFFHEHNVMFDMLSYSRRWTAMVNAKAVCYVCDGDAAFDRPDTVAKHVSLFLYSLFQAHFVSQLPCTFFGFSWPVLCIFISCCHF